MSRNVKNNQYFDWLYDLVCGNRYSGSLSYRVLLWKLHNIEFIYLIKEDKSRASDGIDLRYRFAQECKDGYLQSCLTSPCSVLEMMVALALRCEETIMDDPQYGNRTSQWFWGMITNLGLGYMVDTRFDEKTVDEIIDRFLYRKYEPNGRGGLFTIKDCEYDLRDIEIWTIMLWYLDGLIFKNFIP